MMKIIKNLTKRTLNLISWDEWAKNSWSQEGEDLILSRLMGERKSGFYVDIGAHHPKRFSNTYYYYRKGWRGLNIDAMPGSMQPFNKYRRRDQNVEIGVGNFTKNIEYYMFNEPALNTFSKVSADDILSKALGYKLISIVKVQISTLEEVLNKYLPENQRVDFFNIDVEGLDHDVLLSNNWDKYRPEFILIEIRGLKLEEVQNNISVKYLKEIGYIPVAKSMNTVIFQGCH